MRLRAQIVGQVAVVLGIFAAGSTVLQLLARSIDHESIGLSAYQIPPAREIDDVMRATEEYKTDLLQVLGGVTPGEQTAPEARASMKKKAAAAQQHFASLAAVLDAAAADPEIPTDKRLLLARARGSLEASRVELDRYLVTGERASDALSQGDAEQARQTAAALALADQSLDANLEKSRASLLTLAEQGSDEIHGQLTALMHFGRALFIFAAALGLGFGIAFARRLVSRVTALRLAVDSAAAGNLDIALPPSADDEIGDLTRGFEGLVTHLRDEERLARTFGRFLDPRIAERLAAQSTIDGEYAERRPATILFADIAGFSSVSEKLTAEVLVRLLNRIFEEAATNLRRYGGVVDKYIGDAVMAFFAPPFCPGEAHGAGACLAALDQCATLDGLASELSDLMGLRRGAPRILMRIGIATGDVVMGTLGASSARSFTVIGDAVNAASRFTGVNKVYGTKVLASEETWRVASEAVEGRELDRVIVWGKSEPVTLYEILGRCGEVPAATLEVAENYAKALAAYRRHDFAEAERGFAECLRLSPEDGPARVLRDRVAALRDAPPPEDWDAVWHLSSK